MLLNDMLLYISSLDFHQKIVNVGYIHAYCITDGNNAGFLDAFPRAFQSSLYRFITERTRPEGLIEYPVSSMYIVLCI